MTKFLGLFKKIIGICYYRFPLKKKMDGDEIRWRPPSFLFIPLLLCGGFIFYVDIFQLRSFQMPATIQLPQPRFVGYSEKSDLNGFLIKTEGCRIPYMDPFDSSVVQYISKMKQVVCNKNKPPLMESNLTFVYLLKSSLLAYKVKNVSDLECCYSTFKRVEPSSKESDNKVAFDKCVQFNETAEIKDDFIRVVCTSKKREIYKDFFSFVPIKSKFTNISLKQESVQSLNILIVGLDAVSRVNLHRQMPKTVQLLQEIGAVEFLGYNKVADNTFPNLVPVLAGLNEKELINDCWHKKNEKFDACSFLWKNYSEKGYATAFGEDSTWMGMFNYLKKGFKRQPTDYYWGPFDYTAENQIGNEHDMNVYQCIGSREVYQVLLDYIMKYVKTMDYNRTPYFGLFWGGSLSHDYLNKPKLGDNNYAKFFNQLFINGMLKNTALIFMSDHGIRWGDIRTTYQGRLEERLPFLFIYLPKDYRETYYPIFANLKRNAKRLTSPFDLHETLKDLMNPFSLSQELINKRVAIRRGNERAYSLFEPIPSNRTCEVAGISSHWCTCQKSSVIDKSNKIVIDSAKYIVSYINGQLEGYAECANLTLAEIFNARVHSSEKQLLGDRSYTEDYTIVLRTKPGDANFEVTVRRYINKKNKQYNFNITGSISRINLYGSQSLCMTDFHLKLYCYCI